MKESLRPPIDKLADPTKSGRDYWRSMNELSQNDEFTKFLHREFPENASELTDPVSRRTFLTLMGASMALAGLTGCRRPVEEIVPYVKSPEEITLGKPQHYATSIPFGESSYGVLVESHEGRPTKIEGNMLHPSSGGGTNVFLQASILGLYDPDRSAIVRQKGKSSTWDEFVESWRKQIEKFNSNAGDGLAVLSNSFRSPTMFKLKSEFLKKYPKAQWVSWDPISDENIYRGVQLATNKSVQPVYYYENAKVILSLDSDFLFGESENITAARGFAESRKVDQSTENMNRLYVAESMYTVTGAMADHRLRSRSTDIAALTIALIRKLNQSGIEIPVDENLPISNIKFDDQWVSAVAEDLLEHQGSGLVIAGRRQPPAVHALVYAMNYVLGNIGETIIFTDIDEASQSNLLEFSNLIDRMSGGSIDTLAIIGGNPVYNAPVDFEFKTALKRVPHSYHLSQHYDETSQETEWHIPKSHVLESWGDTRSVDGSLGIIQPLISPLYGGHSDVEFTGLLTTGMDSVGHDLVKEVWSTLLPTDSARNSWRKTLHDGVLEESASAEIKPGLASDLIENLGVDMNEFITHRGEELEIVFQADNSVYDGSYANNGWLQELPDPITKIMWDNAVFVSTKTASKYDLKANDLVVLELDGKEVEMPVWILPGQADGSLSVTLGYGRQNVGRVGNGVGFNSYKLRSNSSIDYGVGVKIRKTGRSYELANSQDHSSMEGRPLIREGSLEEFINHPNFAAEMVEVPGLQSLWREHEYDEGHQWGMAIDLNACIGCNACAIACQSENNVPIVGKEQAGAGREMHWMRLDRYFSGDVEDPQLVTQPVACQHCEMAPCEQVCPVAATVHDSEGLNLMVYNRCVGTRYCSNNCPYKVRRFNFFNFTKELSESVQMAQNPDVTVRSRGVMEKCTYCTQRINRGKRDAKNEGREIADGEITTACQQACPTNAITFGDLNDPDSAVSKMKKSDRDYKMLEELNTRPRTSYLARIRNPNPKLEKA